MWKRATPWIVSFGIGIASSVVSYWVLQNTWLTALIMLATILGTITVLLYLRIEEISKALANLREVLPLQLPQCCGLHMAGFSQVFEKANQSLGLTIELTSHSYKFLGVSAQFVLRTHNFGEMVKRKAQEGCHFQIVLLNPNADEIVERHAAQEGTTKETVALEIQQSIAQLKALAPECNEKLEVWLYRNWPVFRLVMVDDERAFVNFYGAKGMMGVQTPQLVFLKTDRSFFIPFSNFYKKVLCGSTRLI
jgi:hypothetical protein